MPDERRKELETVHSSISEWTNEFTPEFKAERRREYLDLQIKLTRYDFYAACKLLAKLPKDFNFHTIRHAEMLDKKLNSLQHDARVLLGQSKDIDKARIDRARNRSITDFLTVKDAGYMASCPFHADKHPSVDTRNNFYHCYSCGESGDVIKLIMKTRNLTFKQAIDFLA